jgi:hypothetical protein
MPDGTPCDNGSGCTANDGFDHCSSGVCTSPKPCRTVTWKVKRLGQVVMKWDPTSIPGGTVAPGAFCEGIAFVPAAQTQAILPELSSGAQDLVPVTKTVKKFVPPSGKVKMGLRLNSLGRQLIAKSGELQLQVRMTTTNGTPLVSASANRACTILSGRAQLAKVLKCINSGRPSCPQPPGCQGQ